MGGGNVAVVGGSIAGCAATLAAVRGGAERVTVFERAGGELRDRGVGLGIHSERYEELRAAGYMTESMPWVPMSQRVWTVREGAGESGRALKRQPFPFRAYNWGTLWHELKRRIPQEAVYRSRAAVSAVEPDGEGVTVQLADGQRERFDVVIGADGYRSVVREAMFPGLKPRYSGYFGWRGATPGVPGVWSPEDEARTVVFPGGHCMLYRIPDPAGGQRLNWVLYTRPPEQVELEFDARVPTSLPPGQLTEEVTTRLRELVAEHFPPYWAECVLRTPPQETFVQLIYDLEVPRYGVDRMLLVGDAATVARPHLGGGSVKALQDAAALESAWRAGGTTADIVDAYDRDRNKVGAAMVDLGRRLGRAQVEETPNWEEMDEAGFDAWWHAQNQGSERTSGFGGHALSRP